MKKTLQLLTLSFTFSFLMCLNSVQAKMFDLHEFVLDNGLRVIVIPNHKAPIIKHMVWYQVGSVDEVLGKSGKAHLLEHLLFRGTEKVKDSEFNTLIEENGGESNAFTSYDFTAYHQTLDISKLELAMFLEADRMQNLKLTPEGFEKERGIVFQERKQVVDSNPLGSFMEFLRRSLWQEHPYGRPVIGTDEEIKSLTYDDVMHFYHSFYAPNNALLILSGDIEVETAQNLAEKYYGKLEKRTLGERPEIAKNLKPFSSKIAMSLPDINSPRFLKTYQIGSQQTNPEDVYAFVVLAKYLGDGETSKLYKDLVLSQKIALSASASANVFARSYGTFSFSVLPVEGYDIEKIENKLNEAVQKAITEMTEKDVAEVKEKMLAGLVYVRDNPSDAAYIVGSMASIGMSAKEVNEYDEKIAAVRFEDVKKAAQKLLENKQNIVGILTPQKEGK
ncbi:MAG: pitrilysin family protein [Alphaproteobacteria bacterium]|nr:pitrilysin family protein [Alphaproteobacteria bacterium]